MMILYTWGLHQGFLLECYGGIDIAGLTPKGDGWMFDVRTTCIVSFCRGTGKQPSLEVKIRLWINEVRLQLLVCKIASYGPMDI